MSALGNVNEDVEIDSAAGLLADAIEEAPDTGDAPVNTNDAAELARELAAAKAERKALLEGRASLTQELTQARSQATSELEGRFRAEEDAVHNGITAAKSEAERLTAEAARAFEEGRWSDGAALSRDAAAAQVKVDGYEQRKRMIAEAREKVKNAPQQQESAVSQRTQQWIDAHPRFTTDELYNGWAIAAHREALRKNIAPDSDQYFDYVNKRLEDFDNEMNGVTKTAPTPAPTPAPRSNAATVAAPATRRAPNGSNAPQRPGTIRLTAEQRDAANSMFADHPDCKTEEDRLKKYYAGMVSKGLVAQNAGV